MISHATSVEGGREGDMSSSSISAKPDVAVATTTARVTPTPPRTAFKQVLSQTVVGTAEQAMNMLPG